MNDFKTLCFRDLKKCVAKSSISEARVEIDQQTGRPCVRFVRHVGYQEIVIADLCDREEAINLSFQWCPAFGSLVAVAFGHPSDEIPAAAKSPGDPLVIIASHRPNPKPRK
jgi:hypothetical protein